MAGEHLDLSSDPAPDDSNGPEAVGGRPYLGIRFVCCDVYARIYADRRQTAFQGYCPRCSRPVRVRIEPGGSDARFFEAG